MNNMNLEMDQRPASNGLRVQTWISQMVVFGLSDDRRTQPQLVYNPISSQKLLYVLFEIHPLEEDCDQLVTVKSMPVEFMYDSVRLKLQNFLMKNENFLLNIASRLERVQNMFVFLFFYSQQFYI